MPKRRVRRKVALAHSFAKFRATQPNPETSEEESVHDKEEFKDITAELRYKLRVSGQRPQH